MSKADISPEQARDFIREVLDRNERSDGWKFKTVVHMTRDEALHIWAAERWLDSYRTWGVGIEETDFRIDDVLRYLGERVVDLKKQAGQEIMTMTITERGRAILVCAERHLDRYAIARSFPDKPGKRGRR